MAETMASNSGGSDAFGWVQTRVESGNGRGTKKYRFCSDPGINIKKYKSIIGIHIKPELPKNPNITISNNFDKTINELSKNLLKKIL